jgi:hypothetical protein
MRRIIATLLLNAIVFYAFAAISSGEKGQRSADQALTGVTWAKHIKQGFSMKVWLSNQMALGIEAWDPNPVPVENCGVGIGLEYPIGACIEHIFGAGPLIAGIVNGTRRVPTYNRTMSHELVPERKDTARDRIWYTHQR